MRKVIAIKAMSAFCHRGLVWPYSLLLLNKSWVVVVVGGSL